MSTITKEQLAATLTGREISQEITRNEAAQAKKSGLVVVFGHSDDNMVIQGAWGEDAFSCYDGGSWKVGPTGVAKNWDDVDHEVESECADYFKQKATATNTLTAIWCAKEPKCSWAYALDAPHATFDIMEDGELYCRGIIFAVSDLGKKEDAK